MTYIILFLEWLRGILVWIQNHKEDASVALGIVGLLSIASQKYKTLFITLYGEIKNLFKKK